MTLHLTSQGRIDELNIPRIERRPATLPPGREAARRSRGVHAGSGVVMRGDIGMGGTVMFAWSRLEIGLASVLAALIVIGGTAHLVLNARQGPQPIIVEARGVETPVSVGAEIEAVGDDAPVDERDGSDSGAGEQSDEGASGPGVSLGNDDADAQGAGAAGPVGDGGGDAGGAAAEGRDHTSGAAADGETGRLPAYDDRININTAQPSELERLPGIGPALAGRIVAYREEWGPFDAIEDIMEVSGIGLV